MVISRGKSMKETRPGALTDRLYEPCISFGKLLSTLSLCLDLSGNGLRRHHQQVAYMATSLAEEIGLSEKDKDLIFKGSIIHDAGVSTWQERSMLLETEVESPWDHCERGFELVSRISALKDVAELLLYHHDRFGGGNKSGLAGENIPLAARIIHLADRAHVLMKEDPHILQQQGSILRSLSDLSGQVFDPNLVAAFMNMARKECFWLNLVSPFSLQKQTESCLSSLICITREGLKEISEMFARVIDRKSIFTHTHSRSVSRVAALLARGMRFSEEETTLMEIAGLLHDLGKLSIPDEILEKPSSLTREEFSIIRQHSYYTFNILEEAGLPEPIPQWAAHHHEKLDGSGYPCHLSAKQIPVGSRIMAVADVFTALREDRPYRDGMSRHEIERIMRDMASRPVLDKRIVDVLFSIYEEVDELFQTVPQNCVKRL
jgi:putative nucleotidyltransferase with HDIG domain